MTEISGGEAVVRALRMHGVEYVFGLPGYHIMGIYDAFYNQPDIRVITVRHEQTTAYMADGYARVSGKPGVALVVPGPGVQNASAALGTAFACSSPVLLLAGQVERDNIGSDRGALHEINDQQDIIRPITKWRKRVLHFDGIPPAIEEAMRQMRTGRPRPTEVEMPPEALLEKGEVHFPRLTSVSSTSPDPQSIRSAAELLCGAQKPLIWAGGGTILAAASNELTSLAEALGAPVATTPEGKGIIPEDHPLSIGVGVYGHGSSTWASQEADVILAVGTRLTGQMVGLNALRAPQKLVHVDVDPSVIGKNYPAEIGISSDARLALGALAEEVRKLGARRDRWPEASLAEIRSKQDRWLSEKAPDQKELWSRMQRVLPEDTIIVSGNTNMGYWGHYAYRAKKPRSYITSSYFANLGYAFPVSLGAKVAAPDRPVVSVVGDGGFMFALSELATAVNYGLDVIVIVFSDFAFGATKDDQLTRFHGREVGTELNNPNFAELARVFGANGMKVEPEKLDEAIEIALTNKGPTVIEVPIPTWHPPFHVKPRNE